MPSWVTSKNWADDFLALVDGLSPILCIAGGVGYHWLSHELGSQEGEALARDIAIAGLGMLGSNGIRVARGQVARGHQGVARAPLNR